MVGTGFPVNLTSSGPETAPRLVLLGAPVKSYLLRESYVAQQGVSFLTSSGRVRFVLGLIHQCSACLFCPLYVLVLRKYVFTYVVYV